MAITAVSTVATVREKFPQAVVETDVFRGEQTIVLHPEFLPTVCAYLLTGMLFIVFDIEIVSFYPLAILLHQLKVFGLIELLVFLLILMIGYVYVWRKGAFTWE